MHIKDKNGNILCLIVRKHEMSEGKVFYTEDDQEFQFASFRLQKDEVIDRHYHFQNTREIKHTSEAIIVYEGKLQLDIYDLSKEFILKLSPFSSTTISGVTPTSDIELPDGR